MRGSFPASDIARAAAGLGTAEGAEALTTQAADADILVNNMATANPKAFVDLTNGDWRHIFEVNAMSGIRRPAITFRP